MSVSSPSRTGKQLQQAAAERQRLKLELQVHGRCSIVNVHWCGLSAWASGYWKGGHSASACVKNSKIVDVLMTYRYQLLLLYNLSAVYGAS